MKKIITYVLALICIVGLPAGCKAQTPPAQEEPKFTALTEDELAYFNGDSFFNGDDFNFRNQFLVSLYDDPSDIDLYELFYCGGGSAEEITDEELSAVMKEQGITSSIEDLPCPCTKVSSSQMDEILTTYMGITLDDTSKLKLDQFVYLPQYDAYYHFHGDTNYRANISFSKGEQKVDIIRLYYDDVFFGDGAKILTLREKDGTYLFVSNQKADTSVDSNN